MCTDCCSIFESSAYLSGQKLLTFQGIYHTFLSDAKAAGLSEQERLTIVQTIATDPEAGDVIPGTGGARKVRFAGRGRGKSGGLRVITFYSGPDVPVFLLNIFAKGDKINLTHAERNELRAILANIVTAYRQGARRHDQGRK